MLNRLVTVLLLPIALIWFVVASIAVLILSLIIWPIAGLLFILGSDIALMTWYYETMLIGLAWGPMSYMLDQTM